jgi:AmiR/NasT family two-component response regulator
MAPTPIIPYGVLLASNDPLSLETLGRELRAAGLEVHEALDSPTAFDVCMAQAPAAAIIDHAISGSTGVEVAHQIAIHTSVPVVLISPEVDEAVLHNAIKAGVMGFLMRPVEPSQLLAMLSVAIQRGRDFRALRVHTDQLNNALQSGRAVGLATGLLMSRFRLGREDALERLRRHARANRIRLEEVATEVLRVHEESARLYGKFAPHDCDSQRACTAGGK